MTRLMLINARHAEELRVATVQDGVLDNFQVETAEKGLTRGNIYRGSIANIEPSLNAAFIEYSADRHGFLAIQDVVPDAYYHEPKGRGRPRIDEVLERGMPVVVQVTREAEGQKGAVLTTNLSLAGRYLVLTPFDPTRGVSRKVEDEETRRELRKLAAGLASPKGCGVIVRTNALGQTKLTLQRDFAALLRIWKAVETEARRSQGIRLLYSDQDLIVRALRDHLDASVEEVLIDDEEAYNKAEQYARSFLPRGKTQITHYTERLPLFARYSVDVQIDRIYERSVPLPSGGSIVLDRTEALTAIDVNSGKATRAGSQEETALQTNLEAAPEVARQLRLRDLGGLVVVDFIDMRSPQSQRKVEKELREAMKADRARATVGRISPNGLLEINRQRIQQALHVRTHEICAACGGTGRVPGAELLGLQMLRRVEARALVAPLEKARITLHPDLAEIFRQRRAREIAAIERDLGLTLEVVASRRLQKTEHEFEWFNRTGEAPLLPLASTWHLPAPATVSESGAKSRGRRRRGSKPQGPAASAAGVLDVEPQAAPADSPAGAAGGSSVSPAALPAGKPRRRRRRRGGGRSKPAPQP